jgi:hypothetical protein
MERRMNMATNMAMSMLAISIKRSKKLEVRSSRRL